LLLLLIKRDLILNLAKENRAKTLQALSSIAINRQLIFFSHKLSLLTKEKEWDNTHLFGLI
jgi:hypothetical protein